MPVGTLPLAALLCILKWFIIIECCALRTDRAPIGRTENTGLPPEQQAAERLRYIREVMARSDAFTAVPGRGAMLMGATALVAAWLAAEQPSAQRWLVVWLVEALVAGTVGVALMARKASRHGVPLRSGAGRRYFRSLLPPLAAGAVLTLACWHAEALSLLPGLWMLLYGVSSVTGGAFSTPPVPLMGFAFMVLGTATLFLPGTWSDALLAAGFGGFHLVFGYVIWRNHGG